MNTLKLSQINLYLNNPRLSSSTDQDEALIKIVQDQQDKLTRLAEDIVEFGLSELDVLAVFPGENGSYYVAEGNRRITAIKLLYNPEPIKDKFPGIYKRFLTLSKKVDFDFDRINVCIFPSEKDERLIHFLQVRHLGEQGGIGAVKWDAMQKDRFDYRMKGKENLVVFMDSLIDEGYLTQEQIDGVTKTNWDRILRPVGLKFLHLIKDNGAYQIESGYEEEFSKKIKLVADSLNGKTVAIVYDQEHIDQFFEDMSDKYFCCDKESTTLLPNSNEANIDAHGQKPGDYQPIQSEWQAETDTATEFVQPGKKRMPSDVFKDCKTVIPQKYRMQSRNHRISLIIDELKNLEVEQYPNACGCLLRALIELCAKEYISHNNLPLMENKTVTDYEFEDAISYATKNMVKVGTLSKADGRTIRKETNEGGTRELFNGYMHNHESYPSPRVIQGIFQTYSNFLKECLK